MKLPAFIEFKEFAHYAWIGGAMFLLNMVLIFGMHEILDIRYYSAVPVAFAIGSVIHYFIVRKYLFHSTTRSVEAGLFIFVVINLLDALLVTASVALLVEYGHVNLYVARTEAALVIGIFNYILNARYNFGTL